MTTDLVPVPITGYPDEVAMLLRVQQRMGRIPEQPLIPRMLPDGRVTLTVNMLVVHPPRRRDDTIRSVLTALAYVVSLLALSGVLVAALVVLGADLALIFLALLLFSAVALLMGVRLSRH